ncbi:response regulator receiver protein [Methylophaga frappieri]|uniref:Response regulator receiver protein n=1 Tax=Methylophaga frappieri (strain ATCC BAA-2434 / DSM 25690 / JAM7) TaxID=754477 RepID=I1YEA7_METFJ|nr:response regulator [Methylophaga frappieri]AFJ01250.1 response regulator receiver protein [Methylophaga frappieri]
MTKKTKSVLIVDDNQQLRELVRLTLAFSEYQLHEAENAIEALQLIKQIRPDVILLDIMMPGDLNGLDVCAQIKSDPNIRDTRVIILSAKGQKMDLVAGDLVGADAYFVKPFSPISLLESIDGHAPPNRQW